MTEQENVATILVKWQEKCERKLLPVWGMISFKYMTTKTQTIHYCPFEMIVKTYLETQKPAQIIPTD